MSGGSNIADLAPGLPRNFVRFCLLLLTAERPSHGYDYMDRLNNMGVPGVDPGGLYRTLRSMEQEGLLESRWETSDAGPARRTYELSEDGMDWLHAWAAAHAETARIMSVFLDRYTDVVGAMSDASR
ncbi:MAG: PadR family transcriptional regulator [Acidimicrobiia bacterium]|nr:PadR family transcriptional regulator [Acidimicrobiia bacterium]